MSEAVINRCAFGARAYAMKKHAATRLHYDLRLEWDGVLLSWALPEGPSCDARVIRQAIEMENHRKAYLLFEGVHRTGTIMVWDCGTWELNSEFEDIRKSLDKGILRFTLRGEKLKGGWILTRTSALENGSHPVWTLSKCVDAYAENNIGKCVLVEKPNSVLTGRTLEEIDLHWNNPKDKYQQQMRLFDAA